MPAQLLTIAVFSMTMLLYAIQPGEVTGQTKFEREYRIKPQVVPQQSLDFVASFPFKREVRWYINQREHSKTIEAKVRYKRRLYSIDFDSSGNFNDLEVEIRWLEIPAEIRVKTTDSLDSMFIQHRIVRVQAQFCIPSIHQMVAKDIAHYLHEANFEIIIEGKSSDDNRQYEILISEQGELLRIEEIITILPFFEF